MSTAYAYDKNGLSSIVLVELFDAARSSSAKLGNISARNYVGTGSGTLTMGFTIDGTAPKRVLIRGIGPALAAFGVTGVLSDPKIELYNANGQLIATNDDWGTADVATLRSTFQTTSAFNLPDATSKDAALLVSLPPGVYSVILSGVSGQTGEALVELYGLP